MGARTRRANLAVPRAVITDLDARHAPHGTGADYVEFARAGDDTAKMVYGANGPKVRSSVGGHQKVGPMALAWRDHVQGKDQGVWTSPDVAGARFIAEAQPGQALVLAPSTQPGEIVVRPCKSKDEVPACVALRYTGAGKYGPVAFGGVHWFPGSVSPENEASVVGDHLISLAGAGVTATGLTEVFFDGSDAVGPLNAGQPVVRVLAITPGWWLGHVILGAPEGMIRNEWDSYNNHSRGKPADEMMSWHLWGDPEKGKYVGLGDQLFVVDGIGEPATLGNKIGDSVSVTHLSLRLGARFYASRDMKGPIQFVKERVPNGWIKAPLYYDGPKASGEIGSWVPAFPPPETKPKAKPPTTTETPKPPKPPTTPRDDPPNAPPPGRRPPVTTEPGDGGPTIPSLPDTGPGLPPLPSTPPTVEGLKAELGKLGDRMSAAEKAITNLERMMDLAFQTLGEIGKKLKQLEAAAANAKSCGAAPNSNSTSGGGGSGGGGNSGGGLGANTPAKNNPPSSGAPAPTGDTGGPHAGGVGIPRGLGQTPTGCGGNDTDPSLDDSLCSTSVDPDPFPSAASGGLQSVPGTVGVPGAVSLNHPASALDSDGPAFAVYADRAGQLWTTVDGMGGAQVKLTWNPDSGEYALDLWQTDYRPVSGPSQTENFVAGLAAEFGMVTNRHGQITDFGTLGGGSPGAITGELALTGIISPSQITSNQNDYAPTGFSTATVLRLSTDASRDLTGLAGGTSGKTIIIINVGSQNLVLKNQNIGSSAANRFALGGSDITIASGLSQTLWYDGTSSRWRPI